MSGLVEFLLARLDEEAHYLDHGITTRQKAREIRRVKATRQIVELVAPFACVPEPAPGAIGCRDDTVLGLLALPYCDHPDYNEEWKP